MFYSPDLIVGRKHKFLAPADIAPALSKLYSAEIELNHLTRYKRLLEHEIYSTPPNPDNENHLAMLLDNRSAVPWYLVQKTSLAFGAHTDIGIAKKRNEDKFNTYDLTYILADILNNTDKAIITGALTIPPGFESYADIEFCNASLDYAIPDEYLKVWRALMKRAPSMPMFFAHIFDGHNGEVASQFVNDNFLKILLKQEEFWKMEFYEAFKKVYGFIERCQHPVEGLSCPNIWDEDLGGSLTPGTTCVTAMILGPLIIVTDLGDSRVLLSRGGDILDLTFDHRPNNEIERWRLTYELDNYGGYSNSGYLSGFLAVSRALGGYHRLSRKKLKGLISEADYISFNYHPEDEFLLLACDGVFDVMSSQQCGDFVRRYLRNKAPHSLNDFDGASKSLIQTVKARGGDDNLTVVIIGFKYDRL